MDTIKKISNIALKVVTWLLVAFTVFMTIFTIVTVTTVDKNERSVFGYRFYIVKTDSMSKSDKNAHLDVHFNAGDIVIIKTLDDPTKLQAGDIISFMSTNTESYGETVTHMIREVKTNSEGRVIGYVTYGTNTGVDDETLVEPAYVFGAYSGKLPGVGNFFAFVKTVPGYIVCILVPFLLLILYNGINVIRLFRKYRREQMEEMQAERNKIEEERAEAQRMMAELMELKAQLAKKDEVTTPPAAPASEEKAAETATEEASVEEDATEKTATEEAGAENTVAEEPKAEETESEAKSDEN